MAPSRMKIERILCPTDYSEFSERALARAVRLADWFKAVVTVVHVAPAASSEMSPDALIPVEVQADLMCAERGEHAATLERFVAPYRGQGVTLNTRLLEGDPSRLIQATALELPADLLVMGTHGRGGFEHLLLGSVTEKILRRATCPVLTVGAGTPSDREGPVFRRILCALDLTAGSARTLDVAVSLAEESKARVTLLHVLEGMPGQAGPLQYRTLPEFVRIREELFRDAEDRLRRSVPPETRQFCSVSERVEEGAPWREVLRVAEAADADLIVMGVHSGGAVDRALFGSTVNHVVRTAHCPVLTVRETTGRRPLRKETVRGATAAVLEGTLS